MIRNCIFLLISIPLVFSSYEKIDCHSVRNFDIDLSNGTNARVSGAELSIYFSKDNLRVITFVNTDLVKILLDDTILIFKGDLNVGNSVEEFRKIEDRFSFQTQGTANLKKGFFRSKLENCSVILPEIENDGLSSSKEVENELRKYAEVCMINQLCKKIGSVKSKNLIISTNSSEFEIIPLSSRIQDENIDSETNLNLSIELRSYINDIIDIVIKEIVKHLKKNHDEKVKIPDIDEYFTVGSGIFQTNGHFTTADGYFSDVTTFKRTSDAVLDKKGKKFSASCGFGLSKAFIEYDHYKLKFGIIKLDGTISARIDGIAIEAKASVDYNTHPCKSKIEYFKIVDYGEITIEVTGLSPFNSLASSLASWISKQWEDKIISMIKTKILKILDKEIEKFDCEKYRPRF